MAATLAAHRDFGSAFSAVPVLVTNGRILQLQGKEALLTEDYSILEHYEREQRTTGLMALLKEHAFIGDDTPPPETSRWCYRYPPPPPALCTTSGIHP